MEIKNIFISILGLFSSIILFSCSDDNGSNLISSNFYYLTNEGEITNNDLNNINLNPTALAISGNKLFVCNDDQVLVFNTDDYTLIDTITTFRKENTEIALSQLTSISIHNNRIYLGSQQSRLFVLDLETYNGITFLGNGQWWQTFVHVFGVVATDQYVFVKEKEKSIKVFETAQIHENTNWNLAPIAKLTTRSGFTENYSLKFEDYNLVIAGRDQYSYLYYNITNIQLNAKESFDKPIEPRMFTLNPSKPIALTFTDQWVYTIENKSGSHSINIYPKGNFMFMKYEPILNNTNPIGEANFGNIVDIAVYNDIIFLADNSNKKIKILRQKSAKIQEK